MADTAPAKKTPAKKAPAKAAGPKSSASAIAPSVRRVAVIGGNRIPFARSNTVYIDASNQEMLTAALDGLVDRLSAELDFPVKVIATGGLASLIGKHTRRIEELDPNLTLEGLRILYERNSKAPAK